MKDRLDVWLDGIAKMLLLNDSQIRTSTGSLSDKPVKELKEYTLKYYLIMSNIFPTQICIQYRASSG